MTKLCPRGKAAAKRKFRVYPSAYANAYASKICAGKIKDPSGVKRKDFKGRKPASLGGPMDDKRDVRKVEQMIGKSRSSKREQSRKKEPKFKIVEKKSEAPIGAFGGKKKPKLKQPDPMGSIDKKQGPGRIIDGKFYPAMAKGGRAGYRMGGKCKLAMKGKGRAYGKNS